MMNRLGLLAEVPESYKPLILGRKNSDMPITSIKTKLLQDGGCIRWVQEKSKTALVSNKFSMKNTQQRKDLKCFE